MNGHNRMFTNQWKTVEVSKTGTETTALPLSQWKLLSKL